MALVSSKIAAGVKVLADTLNKLRTDLLFNHDHSGSGHGAVVDHGDLADTSYMTGTYHDHDDIEMHMNGTDASFDDTPGGAKGVHGLASGMNVFGCAGKTTQVEDGIASGPDGIQYIEVFGEISSINDGNADIHVDYGDGFTFTSVHNIIVSPRHGTPSDREHLNYYIHSVSTTGFNVLFGNRPLYVYWRAIGIKV